MKGEQNADSSTFLETIVTIHSSHLCRLNHGPGRVSQECAEVLEEPASEKLEARVSGSRVVHLLWFGRQLIPKVYRFQPSGKHQKNRKQVLISLQGSIGPRENYTSE